MKNNLWYTLMIPAAMLTLSATAAHAQDVLTAKIPFAFRAVGSAMPAGEYKVRPVMLGSGAMELRNLGTGKAVFIPTQGGAIEERKDSARARIVFSCGRDAGCALDTLWAGTGKGMKFSTPRLALGQGGLETIYLDRAGTK